MNSKYLFYDIGDQEQLFPLLKKQGPLEVDFFYFLGIRCFLSPDMK